MKKLKPIVLFLISFLLSEIACEKHKQQEQEEVFKVALPCNKEHEDKSKNNCVLQIDSIVGTKAIHFHTYKTLDSMYKAAYYYSRKLMPTESIHILKIMEGNRELQKNLKLLARVYGLLSNEYIFGLGDLAQGLKYNLETLKIYQKIKEELHAKSYVAHAYLSMGNKKEAAMIYKELEDAYHKKELSTKQVNYQSYLICTQSEIYIDLGESDKAMEINKRFLKWLDEFEDKGDWNFMEIKRGETFLNLSVAYMQKNIKDSARYYLSLSDKILGKPIYEDIRSTQIYAHQFNLAMFLQDYDKAKIINTSYASKLDKDNKTRNILLMENTAKLHAAIGNYNKASKNMNKLSPLRKQTYEKEKRQKTVSNYFLNTYNNQQKEFFKTKRKGFISFIFLVTFLIATLIILVFLFYRVRINKRIKNINKLIAEQKEQLDRHTLFLSGLKEVKKCEEKELIYKKTFEKIEKILHKTLAFVNPDFSRDKLANLLNTNRQYLIEAIQWKTQLSFGQYIKQKRMEFAYQLIEKHPEYEEENLAKCSGYNNKKTFNRHFVEFYKDTPNCYKEKLKNLRGNSNTQSEK